MARTFTVTRPGSTCVDCGEEMQNGETAVYLGRNRYAHERACTTTQQAAQAAGHKNYWAGTTDETPPAQGEGEPEPTVLEVLRQLADTVQLLADRVTALEEGGGD
jgi:hypothetical protein